MKHIIVTSVITFAATFAVASWVYRTAPGESPGQGAADNVAVSSALATRVASLEQTVLEERNARQLLQEEVLVLIATLDDEANLADSDPVNGRGRREEPAGSGDEVSVDTRRERFARRNSPEGKIERLIDSGMDPSLASWIVRREEELQMEALQARYQAGQSGTPADFYRNRLSSVNALRDELGDDNYERYLAASGRPTSVSVSSVLGSSPAQAAGLKAGDIITRYDGNRVFSMTEINLASMNGQAGESVAVDILRDGIAMQVAIPRGPLGITGGRR